MINSGFCKENKVMKSKNRVANAERNHQNVSGSSNIAEQRNKNGPTSGEIRRRACEIYAERGGIDGLDLEDWLQAERELRAIQGQRSTPEKQVRYLGAPSGGMAEVSLTA